MKKLISQLRFLIAYTNAFGFDKFKACKLRVFYVFDYFQHPEVVRNFKTTLSFMSLLEKCVLS